MAFRSPPTPIDGEGGGFIYDSLCGAPASRRRPCRMSNSDLAPFPHNSILFKRAATPPNVE